MLLAKKYVTGTINIDKDVTKIRSNNTNIRTSRMPASNPILKTAKFINGKKKDLAPSWNSHALYQNPNDRPKAGSMY